MKKVKSAYLCCLVFSIAAASSYALPDVEMIWQETVPSAGNAYYGNVYNDTYIFGQIQYGVYQFDDEGNQLQRVGRIRTPDDFTAKSVVWIGDTQYFTGGGDGLASIDNWDIDTLSGTYATDQGTPEMITYDGTYIYSNDNDDRNNYRKYEVGDEALTSVWSTTLTGADRVRGSTYYDGNVYAAANLTTAGPGGEQHAVWQINADDGSESQLFMIDTPNTLMQSARFDDIIYSVGRSGNLYRHVLVNGDWQLHDAVALGVGDVYGLGIHPSGDYLWTTSAGMRVSYFNVPEPSTLILLGLGGLMLLKRRRM